jgi:leader peptidase (prepilin peptidase)/N-methyltransferase
VASATTQPAPAPAIVASDAEAIRPARRSATLRRSAGALAIALGALAFASYPLGAGAVIAAFVAVVLVVLAAIDIERRIIPNRIVLPAAGIVLVARVAEFPDRGLEFAIAAIATALILLLPNLLNASAMGMGDVKLGLLLGAALGWGAIGAILVALLCVGPVAAAIVIRGGASARKATMPLGPFFAIGALVILIAPRL